MYLKVRNVLEMKYMSILVLLLLLRQQMFLRVSQLGIK